MFGKKIKPIGKAKSPFKKKSVGKKSGLMKMKNSVSSLAGRIFKS